MKSGLEGRNNIAIPDGVAEDVVVSMKSGLEGRNNFSTGQTVCQHQTSQ